MRTGGVNLQQSPNLLPSSKCFQLQSKELVLWDMQGQGFES